MFWAKFGCYSFEDFIVNMLHPQGVQEPSGLFPAVRGCLLPMEIRRGYTISPPRGRVSPQKKTPDSETSGQRNYVEGKSL